MTELKNDRYLRRRCASPLMSPSMDDAPRVAIYRNIKPRAPGQAILCRCAKTPSWRAK